MRPSEYRSIVCRVYDTELSKKGLETAAYLGKLSGARLYLLYVVEKWHKVSYVATDSKKWNSIHNEWITDGRRFLKEAESHVRKQGVTNVESILREGDAEEEMILLTKEKKPDLLIMPTNYTSSLEKIFMGDLVERVAKKIPCQVLWIF